MMPPVLRPGRLALVLGMAIGLFGCDRPHPEFATPAGVCADRPVRMAVASSLRDVAEELRRTLRMQPDPVEVEPVFGASSILARQLALGAPIDVFVSADAGIVEDLVDRDLLDGESAFEFARGRLVLVGRNEASAADAGPDILASPGLERIAIPSPAVPLGRYATSWLRSRGWLTALAGRIVRTENARATL
ncbi:MAG TPA: molybdate ABC transporter substrate-binding protein, partial [Deltaproteobacteria bacterium]|nr:molybdate ABC transporter substrate-binding protein [Deltaproteobacteria bacterium]